MIMKKTTILVIVALTLLTMFGVVGAKEPVTLPLNKIQQSSDYFSPILGLCEDYPYGTWADEIEKDFDLMAKYGIADMRVSIAWRDYEFARDYTDWELMDEKVALAEEYGVKLYPYICYAPTWATGATMMSPPMDYQDWYNFVFETVTRYKDNIDTWELWNEGDNEEFWVGTWEEQLKLIKVGAQAVKDADPTATTVFGGLTQLDPRHVNTIYTSGVAEYVDVINIHFYHETWNPSPTEQIYNDVKGVADVIRRHGGEQELWIAEIGYSDYVEPNGRVSYWVRTKAPYEKTQAFQAVSFARAYSRIVATEDVSNILWYEIKNLAGSSDAIGDVNNYHLGALDGNYFPKHLWFAISSVNHLFAKDFKVIDNEITVTDSDAKNAYVHAFERENGDVIVMAWNRGLELGEIEVTVPNIDGKAFKHSVTGIKTEFPFTTSGNDSTLALTLNPEDIQIIEIVKDEVPAMITFGDWHIAKSGDGEYTITATATNLGQVVANNVVADIFTNDDIVDPVEVSKDLGDLQPGEEVTINWTLNEANNANSKKAWLSLRGQGLGTAGVLLEF